MYPTQQQDINRIRHISQNQNTIVVNRQKIHPRRNRNFQTPRITFSIPQSPTPSISESCSTTLSNTPTLTPNIQSEHLGSTPTSAQIRENPFNQPNPNERLPHWATQSYSQGEPNLVNDPIDTSSDTTFSSLPETLSLPSTPSLGQISPSIFPLNISHDIETSYSEQPTNIPLRLDWNTFVAPPPLLGQHNENRRLHSWALNRLQYRQDIHEDIREHNVQILNQNSLQLKFEITVKLNNIVQHLYPLSPSNITAQTLPPPFVTTEVIYKYDRYTKTTIGFITFYNPYSGLSYKCIF